MSRELDDPADAQASVDKQEIERLRAEVERLKALNEGGVRLENYVRDNATLAAESARLREALQTIIDGVPAVRAKPYRGDGKISKHDYCPHGLHVWQDCEECICDFARAALSQSETPSPQCPRCGFTREVTKLE